MKFNAAVILVFCVAGAAAVEASAPSPERVVWTTLAQAKESFVKNGKVIEFPREVAALDRKRVTIQGFRVPLEVKTHFLLAAKPSDCPHCIGEQPESYVEVFSREPVKPTFGRPLTVAGKLELLRNDPTGIYYRLTEAELVSVD
jgi:hypothetical protein